ncbi:hypothetical protein KXJ72_08235 [Comamonas aquatica]|nr:hypothetical protein KXJ72_08235 [Comamonas aquatica]
MACLYRLVLLLAFFCSGAFALEKQPADGWKSSVGTFSTPMAACLSVYPGTTVILNQTATSADCGYKRWDGVNLVSGWMVTKVTQLQCPANSSPSGNSCSCNAGYQESASGNSCEEKDPCELLADMCSGSQGKTSAFSLSGKKTGVSFTCMSPLSFGGDPLPGCTKGCMAQVGGFTTAFQSDGGNWVTQGTAKYSGSTCDPSVINDLNSEADPEYEPEENPETSNPPDPSCPGGFKGEVNGVSVCVPPKASSGISELEEKDNGDGTKTNTKTEVKCENGKCEVTKTSTTTNTQTNSTVSSSSTTTTVDKADYCSKNSSAGVCKNEQGEEEGKGSFGGSCQAGFTCKGDAAMCAMAKEQHKRNCETLEEDKDPASFINQVKNGTDSQSAKAMQDNASQINIATQLDKSGYGWSRSCPANTRIDLSFVNGSFEMPFDKLCGPLKIFSDIALAITALSLLVWLVFAGREKAGT